MISTSEELRPIKMSSVESKLKYLQLDSRPSDHRSPKQPDKSKLQLNFNSKPENSKLSKLERRLNDLRVLPSGMSKSKLNSTEPSPIDQSDMSTDTSPINPSLVEPSPTEPSPSDLSSNISSDLLPIMQCNVSPIRPDQQVNQCDRHLIRNVIESGSFNNQLASASITTSFIMRSTSWWNAFLGCLVPLVDTIRYRVVRPKPDDDWVVPFGLIHNQEFITSGAEGSVFRAKLNSQTIAVKRVKNKAETEIKHLKQLKHHNIVRFIGICTSPYCVLMEYCPNGTLSNLLKRQKNDIEPELIWEFAFQISKYHLISSTAICLDLHWLIRLSFAFPRS